MTDGYTFTAADGHKYRIDGIGTVSKGDWYMPNGASLDAIFFGSSAPLQWDYPYPSATPRIIVTRVEPRYEVTVVLTEEQFNALRSVGTRLPDVALDVSQAIRNGLYRQLDD